MNCEICGCGVHLVRCPNAKEPMADSLCEACGRAFFAEELEFGVCGDCWVGAFSWEVGEAFVREDPVAFFEWLHDLSYRTNDNHVFLTALFLGDMFQRRGVDFSERLALLREYCLDSGEDWAKFLKVQRSALGVQNS